jgi:hypothetical protein
MFSSRFASGKNAPWHALRIWQRRECRRAWSAIPTTDCRTGALNVLAVKRATARLPPFVRATLASPHSRPRSGPFRTVRQICVPSSRMDGVSGIQTLPLMSRGNIDLTKLAKPDRARSQFEDLHQRFLLEFRHVIKPVETDAPLQSDCQIDAILISWRKKLVSWTAPAWKKCAPRPRNYRKRI